MRCVSCDYFFYYFIVRVRYFGDVRREVRVFVSNDWIFGIDRFILCYIVC